MAQLQIFFFAYFFFTFDWVRSSRLISIEGDRRLEGSSAQHAMCIYAVGLRRRIHVWDIWRRVNYVVYVWTGRMCWGVGVRYIYLISVILNVYGGYVYVIIRSQHIYFPYSIFVFIVEMYVWFWFAVYFSLRIEIPSRPLWILEECGY